MAAGSTCARAREDLLAGWVGRGAGHRRPPGYGRNEMRRDSMTGLTRLGATAGIMACLAAGAAWAQESTEEIKKELLAKGGQGESVGLSLSAAPAAPTGLAALAPTAPEPAAFDDNPTGANAWLKSIKLSGFADVSYTKNLNDPRTILTNPGRMFDTSSNGFLFNMGEVMLEKVASADSPAGIRLKLGFGKDAAF